MEFVCKVCSAMLSGDGAFVPSRKHFPARFDRIEVLRNVYCGADANPGDVERKDLLPLFDILALLDQQDRQSERLRTQPERTPIGKIVKAHKQKDREARNRSRQLAAEKAAHSIVVGGKHQAALTDAIAPHQADG